MNAPQYQGPEAQGPDLQTPAPHRFAAPQQGQGTASPGPSPATTAITVSTAVIGGIALLAAGATAAFGAVVSGVGFGSWSSTSGQGEEWIDETMDDGSWAGDPTDSGGAVQQSTPIDGVTNLDAEVAAGLLTIEFGDVQEAKLESEDDRVLDWNLVVDGDTLDVESPRDGLGMAGDCLFGCADGLDGEARRVTLTLPRSLAETGGLDADVSVSAGSVRLDGDFRDLGIDVQAGEASVEGTARSLDLEVSTGSATVALAGVATAEASVNAGEAGIVLEGEAPASVEVDVGLGSLTLELPDEAYLVDIEDGPSKVQNGLETDKKSKHRVSAELGAGELILR